MCKRRLRDRLGGSVEKKQQRITQVSHFTVPRKTFWKCGEEATTDNTSFTLHCSPQNFLHVLASLCSVSGLTSGPHRHPFGSSCPSCSAFCASLPGAFPFSASFALVFPCSVRWRALQWGVWDCASPFFFSPCSVGVCRGACHRSSCGTGSPGDH